MIANAFNRAAAPRIPVINDPSGPPTAYSVPEPLTPTVEQDDEVGLQVENAATTADVPTHHADDKLDKPSTPSIDHDDEIAEDLPVENNDEIDGGLRVEDGTLADVWTDLADDQLDELEPVPSTPSIEVDVRAEVDPTIPHVWIPFSDHRWDEVDPAKGRPIDMANPRDGISDARANALVPTPVRLGDDTPLDGVSPTERTDKAEPTIEPPDTASYADAESDGPTGDVPPNEPPAADTTPDSGPQASGQTAAESTADRSSCEPASHRAQLAGRPARDREVRPRLEAIADNWPWHWKIILEHRVQDEEIRALQTLAITSLVILPAPRHSSTWCGERKNGER